MKRIGMLLTSVALMASTAGCSAIGDAFRAVEDAVKAPPQAVMDALRVGADFVMGLLNMLLHGVFSGLLGGIVKNIGL